MKVVELIPVLFATSRVACARVRLEKLEKRFSPCWTPHGENESLRCHCKGVDCEALAIASRCSALPTCSSIGSWTGLNCGWCWDSSTTEGQQHGGRVGNVSGPTDGLGDCNDWTFLGTDCHAHVDCPGDVKTCRGIHNTRCGWCGATHTALHNTRDNQISCSSQWITDWTECGREEGPTQVRLSFAGNRAEIYAVTWATNSQGTTNSLTLSGPQLPQTGFTVQASSTFFDEGNSEGTPWIHRVVFGDARFKAGKKYTYSVKQCVTRQPGSECYERAGFEFQTKRVDFDKKPFSTLLYGDMGRDGGGQIMRELKKEVQGKGATQVDYMDQIIHLGDFAYNLNSENGLVGDTFFTRLEPIASRIPYMTCPGNHEIMSKFEDRIISNITNATEINPSWFAHYRGRMTMPRGKGAGQTDGSDSEHGSDMWYSYDMGPVHFISWSDDLIFTNSSKTTARMAAWLRDDLEKANKNRAQVPWIVAFTHRPMYCSNTDHDDCTTDDSKARNQFEELFHTMGVDISISAHEHSYERLFPVWNLTTTEIYPQDCVDDVGCNEPTTYLNPSAVVHFVSGAAGCNERYGECINPIETHRGPWSAFYLQEPGTYSYVRMTAYNTTTLRWQVVFAEQERVVDDVWIVQHTHGPRRI